MRRLIALAVVSLGCAPAAKTPLEAPSQVPPRVQATTSGYDVLLNSNAQPVGGVVAAPVDKVWPAAVDAFTRVGLKIDESDAASHQVRGRVTIRRQLNGKSLSSYFNCGSEMTGAIADTWRITVEARMGVGPGAKPETSIVQTMLEVTARPIEGTSTTVTPCSSNGQLETILANTVRKLVPQD